MGKPFKKSFKSNSKNCSKRAPKRSPSGARIDKNATQKPSQKKRNQTLMFNINPNWSPNGVPKWSPNRQIFCLGVFHAQGWLPSGLQTLSEIDFRMVFGLLVCHLALFWGPFGDHVSFFVDTVFAWIC